MMDIENSKECFVKLWLLLELTRQRFIRMNRRFCIRRICQYWFDDASNDFIFQVCVLCEGQGYDELPPPTCSPHIHRKLLQAIVAARLGIGTREVSLGWLDRAYSEAFPHRTPLNISKKKREKP